MPGRPYGKPEDTDGTLGAAVLRAMGQGLALAGLGMAVATVLGASTTFGFGSVAATWVASAGCRYAAEVTENSAIERERRLREEIAEDIERENASVAEFERAAPIIFAAEARARECTGPFVALLERQRASDPEAEKGFRKA
jgi:hypothetical protein